MSLLKLRVVKQHELKSYKRLVYIYFHVFRASVIVADDLHIDVHKLESCLPSNSHEELVV